MKKIKYFLLILLMIPLNINAKESTIISNDLGKYNEDLYTKARMSTNGDPIYFDFDQEKYEAYLTGDIISIQDWTDYMASMVGAMNCDKDNLPVVVVVGENEQKCYAWSVRFSTFVSISKSLRLLLADALKVSLNEVSTLPVYCNKTIDPKYHQKEVYSDCKDTSGQLIFSLVQRKDAVKTCLIKQLKGFSKLSSENQNKTNLYPYNERSCASDKVFLPIDDKDCDPLSLEETGDGSSTNPKYMLKCNPAVESSSKERKLTGNIYQDSDKNLAYCIQPGKKYSDKQTYYLDTTYDISKCESSNSSFECGLASILNAANEKGYNYTTALVALRLWTGYKTGSDGWWEMQKDKRVLSTTEKIFKETAEMAIAGYKGYEYTSGYPGKNNVLYAKNGPGVLSNAISLFLDCYNGNLKAIKAGATADRNTVNLNNGGEVVTIMTAAKLVKVTPSNSSITATIESFTETSGKFFTKVRLSATDKDCKIKEFSLNVQAEKAIGGMKRYDPKNGPSYQVMFIYDKNSSTANISFSTSCGGTGTPVGCPQLKVKTELPADCKINGTTGKITDPLMDEILDTCRDSKTTTENAERKIFNTGTTYITAGQSNYCKLYCREEADITFMGVTNALAGRQFKYDLPGQLIKDTDGSNVTSTIVKGKKECVSVVDYGKWESAFEAAQDSVLTNFTAMKKWEALKGVKGSETIDGGSVSCGDTKACCSSYEDKACMEDQKITKKETCIICTKYEKELGPKSCGKYINYSFGPAYHTQCTRSGCSQTRADKEWSPGGVDSECDPCTGRIYCDSHDGNSKYAEEKYIYYKGLYESALTYREQLYIDIQNCNLYSSIDVKTSTSANATKNVQNNIVTSYAGEYKSKINEIKYEDTEYGNTVLVGSKIGNTSTYYEAPKYCKGCKKTSEMGNNTKKTLTYYKCGDTSCSKVNIEVPTNTRARIQTSMEADYYQDQSYAVEAYTGNTIVSSTAGTNQKKLDKYIYPVALKTVSGEYKIEVNYSDIIERFTRGGKLTLSPLNNGIYKCYYDVDNKMIIYPPEGGLGFIFRQIDLKQIFGSNRTKGENWSNAASVIKEIEQLGDNIWIDNNIIPEYSVTLTAENRKAIREYNKGRGGYTDKSLTCESGIIKCKSSFLTDIGKYSSEYSLIGRNKWR